MGRLTAERCSALSSFSSTRRDHLALRSASPVDMFRRGWRPMPSSSAPVMNHKLGMLVQISIERQIYTILRTSVTWGCGFAMNGEMSCPVAWEGLFVFVHPSCSRSELPYYYVPKPPLAATCYVPAQCLVPQPPEVYYQAPPVSCAYQPPPVNYVYQPPPVTYSYLPPAQYYAYQPPPVRVQ